MSDRIIAMLFERLKITLEHRDTVTTRVATVRFDRRSTTEVQMRASQSQIGTHLLLIVCGVSRHRRERDKHIARWAICG